MRVNSVNISHNYFDYKKNENKAKLSFFGKSYKAEPEYGQIISYSKDSFNRHVTYFCRSDLDWKYLRGYIKNKYKTPNDFDAKVYACSSGEEPYTLIILLDKIYQGASKSIEAKDIDSKLVKRNLEKQKNGVFISKKDYALMQFRLNLNESDMKKYFISNRYSAEINPEITGRVKFDKSNLLLDVDKFDKEKLTLLMCRNMWPYVDPSLYSSFMTALYDNIAPNSTVVIGLYDIEGENFYSPRTIADVIIEAGFKPASKPVNSLCGKKALIYEK